MSSLFACTLFTPSVKGKIQCECTTLDCQVERKRTCDADAFCYVENWNSVLTRGCINDKTPLLCENRKPAKLPSGVYPDWPFLFCCKEEDFCNKDIIPIKPTSPTPSPAPLAIKVHSDGLMNSYIRLENDDDSGKLPCGKNNDSSKLNPVFIAVPIAGVCVLSTLIIFAVHLLRRRNNLYENCDKQVANLAKKQSESKVQRCDTSRYTDSEQSSEGSETKLFLNAWLSMKCCRTFNASTGFLSSMSVVTRT